MNDIGHHAPDVDILMLCDVDFRVVRILRHKQNSAVASNKAFNRQVN